MNDHFTYSVYMLEQSYKLISEESLKKILDEIDTKAAKEYKNSKEFRGWYSKCLVPLNKLRETFYLGTEEEFNIQLKIALDKDRVHHDSESFDRVRDRKTWYPWDIIAYACRAHDKGWKITVEDSRLPMFLVEGKCNVTTLAPE